ncbi:MAG: transcription antitermination factor NusB [Pseudomonadota bacterium]
MTDQKLPFEVTRARRAGARLAAVQALYQMEQTGESAKAVIRQFCEDRLGFGPDGVPVEEADPDLFKSIVNAVVDHQGDIDPAIVERLNKGWKLTRLDATTRAILRGATAELIAHEHLSEGIILDEYVGVAHAFFEGDEPRFVNGVLDNIAKDVRGTAGSAA